MKTAQSRQKSYVDKRHKDLEFALGDHVFVKVEAMKAVMRFGKKGKLSPRFTGQFEILDRVGTLAYKVALPPNLAGVHNVFHISMMHSLGMIDASEQEFKETGGANDLSGGAGGTRDPLESCLIGAAGTANEDDWEVKKQLVALDGL
ncbi:uncharacterized protein LOC142532276 [Primulina tabacum]|uniref:uncharacterized protein LOC142532276 n=1 Tax=Primulina tabacum TaxID=48773 RepID=UPI003F5A5FE0